MISVLQMGAKPPFTIMKKKKTLEIIEQLHYDYKNENLG